jgi:hypothetical protein
MGVIHVFDLPRLASLCPQNAGGNTAVSHSRDNLLSMPLKLFTSLKTGDSVVLSGADMLGYKNGDSKSLASLVFLLEIAPRLASGVNIVLYGGLVRKLETKEQVGTFLTQAWLTMNDAVEILWYQDSDSADAAGFGGNTLLPSDHVVILRTR